MTKSLSLELPKTALYTMGGNHMYTVSSDCAIS